MSNAILNWRFGAYHFKIHRDRPYVTFTHNPFQDNWKAEGRSFFEVLE